MQADIDKPLEIQKPLQKTTHAQVEIADQSDYLQSIRQHLFIQPKQKIALIYDNKFINYNKLGENVSKLMKRLDQHALKKGAVVAIHLRKSPEYIYCVLACALKGIIWLPIDMDSPVLRRDYLLTNSRVDLVLTDQAIQSYPCLLIDEILSKNFENDIKLPEMNHQINRDAAYYLYTSGSTGTPKCVVLNHLATANVLQQTIEKWKMTHDDVIMAVTPFHHDMSVFDIFASVSLGATLVIPTLEQSKNAVAWAELLEKYKITIWVSVPAIMDMLLSVAKKQQLQSLHLIAQGGDYIKPSLIEKLRQQLPNTRLFSLGGPTETTIWSIWHEINDQDQELIPYGKALENNQYFILNEDLKPCSVGEIGRLYMTGINLSNGYLLEGEISHKDFVEIPISENQTEIAFQMSDLGYFREDGNIIFSGREDGYLKIKGVRISAAEIEHVLSKNEYIQESIIVCCINPITEIGELVAMYTLSNPNQDLDINQLKIDLKEYLPNSHIPSKWLLIEKIPLTPNAKIDRKLLQKNAQEQLYPILKAQTFVSEQDVGDIVLSIFRDYMKELRHESLNIFYQSEILALGIRPKNLIEIAKIISEKKYISIDFYTIASCKTIQDVVQEVEKKVAH